MNIHQRIVIYKGDRWLCDFEQMCITEGRQRYELLLFDKAVLYARWDTSRSLWKQLPEEFQIAWNDYQADLELLNYER